MCLPTVWSTAKLGRSPRESRVPHYELEPGNGNLEASIVHNEFLAIIEQDDDWYIAYCPEVPGANGQGKTKNEATDSLAQAVALILEDRREDGLRGVPPNAIRETITVS